MKTSGPEIGLTTKQKTTACRIFSRITWSKSDTDQTIREIKIHNAKYASVCG